MQIYDQVDLLLHELSQDWDTVTINCDGKSCTVTVAAVFHFQATNLVIALTMAQAATVALQEAIALQQAGVDGGRNGM